MTKPNHTMRSNYKRLLQKIYPIQTRTLKRIFVIFSVLVLYNFMLFFGSYTRSLTLNHRLDEKAENERQARNNVVNITGRLGNDGTGANHIPERSESKLKHVPRLNNKHKRKQQHASKHRLLTRSRTKKPKEIEKRLNNKRLQTSHIKKEPRIQNNGKILDQKDLKIVDPRDLSGEQESVYEKNRDREYIQYNMLRYADTNLFNTDEENLLIMKHL